MRCHGATHSWSPLFADEGQILIDGKELDRQDGPKIRLNQRMEIELYMYCNVRVEKFCSPAEPGSQDPLTVTVSSSVNLQELLDFFLEHKICFESNAILRNVTAAGIVSTGVHVSIANIFFKNSMA